ncbi:MAG: PucR family transcriptional regulator ligand-binding domain-containing protein, partial [Nocardioidaceae bacterium]
MPVRLSVVLSSPSLAAADPVVVSGADNLDRLVRWVHSSEVLDIAPLLHGGELLLTGGAVLAGSTAAERRRYIRELAARRVAGVAIETGGRLPSIPADMLEEAAAHGFPLVELRRVVPFVDVTEAVNGALVDSSITRLKYSAELTHVLSGIVADGGGAQQIVEALAAQISVPVALFDGAGGVLASSPGTADPGTAGRNSPDARRAGITSPVSVRGVHAATLALYPDDDADLELLHLAADRG